MSTISAIMLAHLKNIQKEKKKNEQKKRYDQKSLEKATKIIPNN